MKLQKMAFETILAEIGRAAPQIGGAPLHNGRAALCRPSKDGASRSHTHSSGSEFAITSLGSMTFDIRKATERDRAASMALIAGSNS
jgi:hypothetical protein